MNRLVFATVTLFVLLQSAAMADGNAEGVYHYRSNIMEISFNHLKALKDYVNGKVPIRDQVPTHVDALLELNSIYQDLFPLGQQHPESEALPAIWSDPKGFRYAIRNNRQKILDLKKVDPENLTLMKRAVNEVRMSCGDCHSYYRDR